MIETKWRPHANITLGSLWNSRSDQLKIIQGYSSCSLCKVKLKGHSPSTFGKANSPPYHLMLKRATRKYQDRVSRPKVKRTNTTIPMNEKYSINEKKKDIQPSERNYTRMETKMS